MASKRGKDTAEYQTMVDCNNVITNSFKANLVSISEVLHREGFIPKAVAEEMGEVSGLSRRDKAAKLRNLITDKVEQDVVMFYRFCDILKKNEAGDVAEILTQQFAELQGT